MLIKVKFITNLLVLKFEFIHHTPENIYLDRLDPNFAYSCSHPSFSAFDFVSPGRPIVSVLAKLSFPIAY